MIRECIELIRMKMMLLRYARRRAKVKVCAYKMCKYVVKKQGKFKTEEANQELLAIYNICRSEAGE